MPLAILIGFEYKIDILPGTIIDLYHCYKWCQSFTSNIKILTDITCDSNKSLLSEAIKNKLVKKDIYKFYDTVNPIIIFDNLIPEITEIIKNDLVDNKLIIYYTGHGVSHNNLVMPNESLLSTILFKNELLKAIPNTTEIFMIFDCCNPNGMNLPFKLSNNNFRLSLCDNINNVDFTEHKILLLTSAANHQKSVATQLGSLFTRYLFRILNEMNDVDIINDFMKTYKYDNMIYENIPLSLNRNLQRLSNNLCTEIKKFNAGYNQNITIYSSYVIDPILWTWLGVSNDYDITTDYTLNKILVISNS